MTFDTDLEKGSILNNKQLCQLFGCSTQGGMRRSLKTNTLVIVSNHVESIYDDKKIYPTSDSTKEERAEFIESLNQNQFKLLQKFIENMPKLKHKLDFTCEHCKAENSITVQGLKNFF